MKRLWLPLQTSIKRRSTALIRNQRGTAGIEMAFVAPVLMVMLTGMLHFGSLFLVQNNMSDVARETARRVAVGDLTETEGKQFALDNLSNWGATYTVTVTPSGNDISVDIVVPMADAALVDPFGLSASGTIKARSTMRQS